MKSHPRSYRISLLCLLISLVFTCASTASAEQAVVGTLKTRDRIIEIVAGEHSPLYTVKTPNGKLLVEGLTQQALAERYPDLGKMIERGIADDASLYPKDPGLPAGNDLDTGL